MHTNENSWFLNSCSFVSFVAPLSAAFLGDLGAPRRLGGESLNEEQIAMFVAQRKQFGDPRHRNNAAEGVMWLCLLPAYTVAVMLEKLRRLRGREQADQAVPNRQADRAL
jgi:hypothetical protein